MVSFIKCSLQVNSQGTHCVATTDGKNPTAYVFSIEMRTFLHKIDLTTRLENPEILDNQIHWSSDGSHCIVHASGLPMDKQATEMMQSPKSIVVWGVKEGMHFQYFPWLPVCTISVLRELCTFWKLPMHQKSDCVQNQSVVIWEKTTWTDRVRLKMNDCGQIFKSKTEGKKVKRDEVWAAIFLYTMYRQPQCIENSCITETAKAV